MQLSILITIALMAISMSAPVAALPAKPIQVLSARRLSLVDERALNSDFTSLTRSYPHINGDNARRRRQIPSSGGQFYARSTVSLGQHLRSARVRSGLSQAELARRVGTAPATVSRYEEGKLEFSASMLTAMEKVLGVKLH
ncbi:hypothetical protein JOM56_006981 [Amanita muscaria]